MILSQKGIVKNQCKKEITKNKIKLLDSFAIQKCLSFYMGDLYPNISQCRKLIASIVTLTVINIISTHIGGCGKYATSHMQND